MNILTNTITTLLFVAFLSACSPSGEQDTNNKNQPQTNTSETEAIPAEAVTSNDFPHKFEQVDGNTWVMHGPRELPNPENKGFMNNPGGCENLCRFSHDRSWLNRAGWRKRA